MASLRLQNNLLINGIRCFQFQNQIFRQACRRKHVLCFKANESVFRNLKRYNVTGIVLNGNVAVVGRLASTFVVETDPLTSTTKISPPTSSTVDVGTLPPIPEVPTPVDISEVAAVAGEPTFQSIGLGGYSPVGLVQQGLEFLHIGCDLPWWTTIMIGTVVFRMFVFPLVIMAQRNGAKMNNCMPQMQLLQLKMSEARQSGNQFEAARYAQELMLFMKEKDISPFKSMVPSLAQAPLFISVFMGLRGMTNVPVDSLRTGGLFWFTDLTVPDQFYLLPLITSLTLYVTIEVGTDAGRMQGSNMGMMKYFLRAMPVIIFPFTMGFPGAILLYWACTNFVSLVQVGILRIPKVRDFFKIPAMVTHVKEDLPIQDKGFVKGFKESMTNLKISRELQDRENFDAVQFQRAGRAPIQRTFKYDPTKEPPPTAQQILAKNK